MSWQLFIIAQTLLVGTSTICIRLLAKNKATSKSSFAVNAVMYSGLYVTFIILAAYLGHIDWSTFNIYWWRFLLGGLAFALTNVFTFKTLVYFDAAIATIVGTVNVLFTVIGAGLYLDEKLTFLQLIGSIVLLSGIFYGVLATQTIKKKNVAKSVKLGLLYALLAGISFGIAAVNEKSLLEHMNIGTYSIFGIGGQFLMAIITAILIQPKQFKKLIKSDALKLSLFAGVIRGLGGMCFIYAEVKSNNVALVTVISNFKLIVVILLGWWLLKERKYVYRKITSALVSISGLVLMFWV